MWEERMYDDKEPRKKKIVNLMSLKTCKGIPMGIRKGIVFSGPIKIMPTLTTMEKNALVLLLQIKYPCKLALGLLK